MARCTSTRSTPSPRRRNQRLVVPALIGQRNLTETPLLRRFIELAPPDAIALVKAARHFQEAAWLAERSPEFAWLFFVSAVETAAAYRKLDASALETFRRAKPELAERLLESGDELVAEVAQLVVNETKATGKFVEFTTSFAPALPEPRPPEWACLNLSSKTKKSVVYSAIYRCRSDALHSGKPFPQPMCSAPHVFETFTSETPGGSGAGYGTATWTSADTPILLNTFVYLVRGALLKWWESLLPQTEGGEQSGGA